eukprot:5126583-Prymnesium_polylepis.1
MEKKRKAWVEGEEGDPQAEKARLQQQLQGFLSGFGRDALVRPYPIAGWDNTPGQVVVLVIIRICIYCFV